MIRSPFSQRKPQDFRVLMFYPNLHMSALMPQVIGIFTALFKREGYTIDLFDATYYKDFDNIFAKSCRDNDPPIRVLIIGSMEAHLVLQKLSKVVGRLF